MTKHETIYFAILFLYIFTPIQSIKVCNTIVVRNYDENFSQFRDCEIVDGNVKILSFKHPILEPTSNDIDFEFKKTTNSTTNNLFHFPNLKEIRGYLLIYRSNDIKSLYYLFPKLTVIKGKNLFYNYAFVVYEVASITNLGLYSLVSIERGAIRIEKNPSLCYLETIKWDSVLRHQSNLSIISSNKQSNQCVDQCPTVCIKDAQVKNNLTNLQIEKVEEMYDSKYCLGPLACQKICKITSCIGKDNLCAYNLLSTFNIPVNVNSTVEVEYYNCCHSSCIYGCFGFSNRDCFSCKNFYYKGKCVKQCPKEMYIMNGYRCVDKKYCLESSKYNKLMKNLCVKKCPPNTTVSIDEPRVCIKCKNACPVICPSATITSIESAERFVTCSVIDGSLIISVKGGNYIASELSKNLGNIKTVRDYVIIKQSHSLLSLNFLQSLQTIHGNQLFNGKYAFVVRDNKNLEEIWDNFTHPILSIGGNGLFYFNGNKHLCPNIIFDFILVCNLINRQKSQYLNLHSDTAVSVTENGDETACNILKIESQFTVTSPTVVVIHWNRVQLENYRHLLSYQIFYRETKNEKISFYESRDVCDSNIWQNREVFVDHSHKFIGQFLSNLKPYTEYAYYIQTNILLSHYRGLSNLIYFKTFSDYPSSPRFFHVVSITDKSIHVRWSNPLHVNGNLTSFIIEIGRVEEDLTVYDKRDYCINKLENIKGFHVYGANSVNINNDLNRNIVNFNNDDVTSGKSKNCETNSLTDKENEHSFGLPQYNTQDKIDYQVRKSQIIFEDYMENNILEPRLSAFDSMEMGRNSSGADYRSRSVRSISSNTKSSFSLSQNLLSTKPKIITLNSSTKNIILDKLNYLSEYKIELFACNNDVLNPSRKLCSLEPVILFSRTLASKNVDNIYSKHIKISNITYYSFTLQWNQPKSPNGRILSYEIEIHRMFKSIKPEIVCITSIAFRNNNHTFKVDGLSPGNYSYRLRSISLAGNGKWTDKKFVNIELYLTFSNRTVIAISSSLVLVFCIVIFVIAALFFKNRLTRHIPKKLLYSSANPEYFETINDFKPDEWEIDKKYVVFGKELGKGSFGCVYKGKASHLKDSGVTVVDVAIKIVNSNASYQERIYFLREAALMKQFNCNHVVKLLGVVSSTEQTLMIMELMSKGDLKTFMRLRRPENNKLKTPSISEICNFLVNIADGMVYLQHRKFVHRDLAARNCLVDENNIVKIGDFGMTRDIYETDYYRKLCKGMLPVRWMSPESLRDGVFSSASDVWSFGIVMWELATMVEQPYQGLANEQVLKYIIHGGVMDKPYSCPDFFYSIMNKCWRFNPKDRITFEEILDSLQFITDADFKNRAYTHSDEYQQYIEKVKLLQLQKVHNLVKKTEMSLLESEKESLDTNINLKFDNYNNEGQIKVFENLLKTENVTNYSIFDSNDIKTRIRLNKHNYNCKDDNDIVNGYNGKSNFSCHFSNSSTLDLYLNKSDNAPISSDKAFEPMEQVVIDEGSKPPFENLTNYHNQLKGDFWNDEESRDTLGPEVKVPSQNIQRKRHYTIGKTLNVVSSFFSKRSRTLSLDGKGVGRNNVDNQKSILLESINKSNCSSSGFISGTDSSKRRFHKG